MDYNQENFRLAFCCVLRDPSVKLRTKTVMVSAMKQPYSSTSSGRLEIITSDLRLGVIPPFAIRLFNVLSKISCS
jgi:hypothetical protein